MSRQRKMAAALDAGEVSAPSSCGDFKRQAEALIPAEVRMISGCHSEQTSADVGNVGVVAKLPDPQGKSGGACTSALLDILYREREKKLTFQTVLLDLRATLANRGFDQIPQLTSSRPLESETTPFTLVGGNGTKRALLVGINYLGQTGQLSGCHSDVLNMKKYLVEKEGYLEHHILVVIDDGSHHYPNRSNIIKGLQQLVAQSVSGDSVFFHYSGHGGLLNPVQNPFKTGQNQYDETIYPLDHARNGQIHDFSLFKSFVKPMPAGVTVTCVMDCCHSGAVLELPYSYQPTSAGTIRAQQSMGNLSNLALLYLMMGGHLPTGLFGNVTNNIESVTGGEIADYEGVGMTEEGYGTGVDPGVDEDPSLDNVDLGGENGDAQTEGLAEGAEKMGDQGGGSPDGCMMDDGVFESPGLVGDGAAENAAVAEDMDCSCLGDMDCSCVGEVLGSILEDI